MSSIYNNKNNKERISNIKSLILNGTKTNINPNPKNIKLSKLGKLFSNFEADLTEIKYMNNKKPTYTNRSNISSTGRNDHSNKPSKIKKKLFINNSKDKKSLSKENKKKDLSFNKNQLIAVNKSESVNKNNILIKLYKNQCKEKRPLSAFTDIKLKKIKIIGSKDKTDKNKCINKCTMKKSLKSGHSININNNSISINDNSKEKNLYNLTQRNTYYRPKIFLKNKTKDKIIEKSRNKYFTISSRRLTDGILNNSQRKRQNNNSSREEENIYLHNTFDESKPINKNNVNFHKYNKIKNHKKNIVSLIKPTKKIMNKTLPDRNKILDSVHINKFNNNNYLLLKNNKKVTYTFYKIALEMRKKLKNKLNNSITNIKNKRNNISTDKNSKGKYEKKKKKILINNRIINKNNECNININNKENIDNKMFNPNNNRDLFNQNLLFSPTTTSITKDNTISIKDVITKKIMKIDSCTIAGYSSPGVQKTNQDNFFIIKEFLDEQEQFFLGVCDGHGTNGHLVSEYITKNLPNYLQDISDESIKNSFYSTNHTLINNSKIDCSLSGSTCTTLIINLERIICANLGDSRAVLAKYENGIYNAVNLSRDHKPSEPDEMKRIILKGGRIKPFYDEELKMYLGPERVWLKNSDIPGLAMTRSMGDNVAHSVGVLSEPEIFKYEFNGNEKFIVLASDGIWEYIDSDECVHIVKDFYENEMDAIGALNCLVKEAFNRWKNMEESIDDITAIVIFFE